MQHLRDFSKQIVDRSQVAVGTFDGVHRGHTALLSQMVQAAHAQGQSAVVVSFWPHPVVVLKRIKGPVALTMPDERADLLGALGVDVVITLEFTPELAQLTADAFMAMLAERTRLTGLWVGADFALGKDRLGTASYLAALGQQLGYQVQTFTPIMLGERPISSTRIRTSLADGKVEQVGQLLGRWYSVSGAVIHGDGRGRKINIPTANISLPAEKLLPGVGVYATRTWVSGKSYPSVTNVGMRPTFYDGVLIPQIETHLLHFSSDLYDQIVRLEFVAFLREEQKFPSVDVLVNQIHHDAELAEEILTHAPQTPNIPA